MPSRGRVGSAPRDGSAPAFEQSARASHSKCDDRASPRVAVRLPHVSAPAHGLHTTSAKENTMFYGIGGTIVIVLLVLFFLGRI